MSTRKQKQRLEEVFRNLYARSTGAVAFSCNAAFGQKIDLTNTKTKLFQDSQRLPRALYFIAGARAQNDLSLKITNYCTAFETLFSTSQAELAHQLSERISFFLAKYSITRGFVVLYCSSSNEAPKRSRALSISFCAFWFNFSA